MDAQINGQQQYLVTTDDLFLEIGRLTMQVINLQKMLDKQLAESSKKIAELEAKLMAAKKK